LGEVESVALRIPIQAAAVDNFIQQLIALGKTMGASAFCRKQSPNPAFLPKSMSGNAGLSSTGTPVGSIFQEHVSDALAIMALGAVPKVVFLKL
jgi:hypothetical protein